MVTEWLWRWMFLFVFGMEYGFEIKSKHTTIDIAILMRKNGQKIIIAQVNSIWRFQHTHTHKKGIVSILSIILLFNFGIHSFDECQMTANFHLIGGVKHTTFCHLLCYWKCLWRPWLLCISFLRLIPFLFTIFRFLNGSATYEMNFIHVCNSMAHRYYYCFPINIGEQSISMLDNIPFPISLSRRPFRSF